MSDFRIDDVFHAGILHIQDRNFEPALKSEEQQSHFSAGEIRLWASSSAKAGTSTPTLPDSNHTGLYRQIVDPYEIRVLELKPGSTDDEELQASLHHCSVEFDSYSNGYRARHATSVHNPEEPIWYTALSYTWGEPVFNGNIVCDGHSKAITLSLEAFLRRFRKRDRSIVLWIDQVCINQDDNAEKEKQIPLMERIYTHALNTIIWLGEANTVSDAAIKLLEDVTFRLSIGDAVFGPEDFERIDLPPASSAIWAELWDLLSRPWFKRVWIVQELILSRDVWVACGPSTMRWDLLSYACNNMIHAGVSSWLHSKFGDAKHTERDDVCRWVEELATLKIRFDTMNVFNNLLVLLVGNRDSKCFDPRDKIYGLLGMCSETERRAVKVRYGDGYKAAQLYHDVATSILLDDNIQQVLSAVDHDSHDTPSWVPDWSKPRQTISLGNKTSTSHIYFASARTKPHFALNPQKHPHELHLRGIPFDTIVETSVVFTNPDLSYTNPTTENTLLISCVDFISKLTSYPTGDTVFQALWQTLVAGKDDTGYSECPPSFAEIFSLLLDESTGRYPSLPGQTYSVRQQRPRGKGRLELSSLSSRVPGRTFQSIRTALQAATRNRRLGITTRGYMGLFPSYSRSGDEVYVIHGIRVPLTLRKIEHGKLRLIGESYIHGIMKGEHWQFDGHNSGDVTLI